MRKIIAENDFGEKETFERWNGQFYTEDDLSQKIDNITEDTAVYRPDATLDGEGVPIAYVITNVFPNDEIRDKL